MISSIKAFLSLYKQIEAVKNIPIFLDAAPANQAEPYCVYSQIPSGAAGIQGAYGQPDLIEGANWQFAFYDLGRDDQQNSKALVLLEAFEQGLGSVTSLTLNDPNAINLSFRRTSELIVKKVGTDPGSNVERHQALAKYELLNQNS